ncbi:MAG: nitroreductase family protein [Candidatus Micrarchaeota archaeon]
MKVSEAIEKRRSIRQFLDKDVEEEKIKDIIDNARKSPSGNNAQPWKFYVLKNGKITEKMKQEHVFFQSLATDAPAMIVCCSDPDSYTKQVEGWDDSKEERALRDLSIASGFLVLRATELGLGTCFIGWLKKDKIKKILKLPYQYLIPYVILVGYPDEKPKKNGRKSISEIMEVL